MNERKKYNQYKDNSNSSTSFTSGNKVPATEYCLIRIHVVI